jgi:hypothetical protein
MNPLLVALAAVWMLCLAALAWLCSRRNETW